MRQAKEENDKGQAAGGGEGEAQAGHRKRNRPAAKHTAAAEQDSKPSTGSGITQNA